MLKNQLCMRIEVRVYRNFRYSHQLFTIIVLFIGMVFNSSSLDRVFAASDLDIYAVGDWGCTENTQKIVNIAKSRDAGMVLALGDYSYASTPDCWFNIIKPIDGITRINIGNHDDGSATLLDSFLKHFGLSKQYYSYDMQNVHVLTMSTEEQFTVGSAQYNFVLDDLQQAATNPNIKWNIVNMHAPLYSSPNTCGDPACEGDKALRDTYHQLFDKYGVDLVLEGHVHNYQRSYPIMYNSGNPSNPIVTSCNKSSYNSSEGQVYAIVGTGGVNLHGLAGKSSFMADQQDSKFGILNIQSSDDVLDVKFIDSHGSFFDQFNITKAVKKPIKESKGVNNTILNQHCADSILYHGKSQTKADSSDTSKDKKPDKPKAETKKKDGGKGGGKGNKGGGKGGGKGNKGGGSGR